MFGEMLIQIGFVGIRFATPFTGANMFTDVLVDNFDMGF